MLKEKYEAVKEHVTFYKAYYISGAGGVLLGGFAVFTYSIMRGHYADGRGLSGNSTEFNVRPLSFLSKQNVNTKIVNVVEREGRGHPGYIVRCKETGDIFQAQYLAAEAFNIPKSVLAGHLNGKFDDVDGLHFERIGVKT